jgi:hypothetical protein
MITTEKIFDATTGEETIVEREENKTEKADRLKSQERITEAEAKAQAKTALLEKLGITEDEAKLLLS